MNPIEFDKGASVLQNDKNSRIPYCPTLHPLPLHLTETSLSCSRRSVSANQWTYTNDVNVVSLEIIKNDCLQKR